MYHLVIDLEMCRISKKVHYKDYTYGTETIQIGAVLLDKNFKKIATLSQYVHPVYGSIDSYIRKLTGITEQNVCDAPLLEEALIHLIDWLGDRDYNVYAWSETDHAQLAAELSLKHIENAAIDKFMEESRWIDYQDVYMKRFDLSRLINLEDALGRAKIMPEGRLHDGLVDAVNTARMIEKLELNPDFEIIRVEAAEKPSEPLSFTLGDLFAGLKFGTD